MVSILDKKKKKLESKVERVRLVKLEVMQPNYMNKPYRISTRIVLPSWLILMIYCFKVQ